MPEYKDYEIDVVVSQPSLIVNGVEMEELSQEALISFGRWWVEHGEEVDKHFTYEWITLQDSVVIHHNLHKKPSVTVVDTAGNELFCDVAYTDDDNLTLTFSCPIRGTAYLN